MLGKQFEILPTCIERLSVNLDQQHRKSLAGPVYGTFGHTLLANCVLLLYSTVAFVLIHILNLVAEEM